MRECHTFATVGDNDPWSIGPADLFAVSLLDVTYGPDAVRSLLDDPSRWTALLALVPGPLVPLWELDDTGHTAGNVLWKAARGLSGVGPTKASKLLARKRHALIPIRDGIIDQYLPRGDNEFWTLLRSAMQDSGRRAAIDELGAGLDPRPTTLRLIDVAIWMRFSRSQNAQKARGRIGAPSETIGKYLERPRPK